jgi:thermitase
VRKVIKKERLKMKRPNSKIKLWVVGLIILSTGLLVIGDTGAVVEKEDTKPKYAPGEVLVGLKEGASIEGLLKDVVIQPKAFDRIHDIKPAINKFKKDLKLEKDSDGYYWFLGKNYKEVEDISDEELFKEAYKSMPEVEKKLYRSYKIRLPKDISVEEAVDKLKESPDVEYAEPNHLATIHYIPNDPLYPQQWAHQKTQAELGWDIQRGDPNVVIAIVDTGVDYNHEDLAANIWRDAEGNPGKDFVDIDTAAYIAAGYTLVEGEDYTGIDNDPSDYFGHGTHCAGIAGAVANNNKGVAGVCHNCKIMPVRAGFAIRYGGRETGALEYDDIGNAIKYAADNGAKVISMSFGGPDSTQLKDTVDYAYSQGVTLVAAAGNGATDQKMYPAGYDNVIAVAATASDDSKSYYSNYGSWVDIAAPGGDKDKDSMILSTVPKAGTLSDPSGYKALQGTSMACPYVAGVASLVLSRHPEFINSDVDMIMSVAADDIGEIGYGRINVYKAIRVDNPAELPTAAITFPTSGNIISGMVNISGSAYSGNLERYTLEYGSPLSLIWSNPEHREIHTANTPVIKGLLYSWDTNGVNDGYSTLELKVYDSLYGFDSQALEVFIGNKLEQGWPVRPYGYVPMSAAALGDLNNDGKDEIFIKAHWKIFGYSGDGTSLSGWPPEIMTYNTILENSPSIGDVDGDGNPEIVAVMDEKNWSSIDDPETREGKLYVFKSDGSVLDGWPVQSPVSYPGVTMIPGFRGTPVLEDMDGDGRYEVIATSSNEVFIYRADGTILSGWPQQSALIRFSDIDSPFSPAVADVDGDGQKEIFAVDINGIVYAWHSDGQPVQGWPVSTELQQGYWSASNPVLIGNVTGDKFPEVIVLTLGDAKIYVFSRNGQLIAGWPKEIPTGYIGNLSLADLDGDGVAEILTTCDIGKVYIFKGNGDLFPGWPQTVASGIVSNRPEMMASPVVADIDGDHKPEVLIGDDLGYLNAWHSNGEVVKGFPIALSKDWPFTIFGSPSVGDIDGDGLIEICISTYGEIFVLKTKGILKDVQWATGFGNYRRAGRYVQPDKTPPTGKILINSNAPYTTSTSVTLNLSATDTSSGMGIGAQMQFSNDNRTWSMPVAYATSCAWTLTSSYGTKTVYAKFKDVAGNWSGAVSDTIILEKDSDKDGFSDRIEKYIGTNPNLACGTNAWPPDFNNDRVVNILDVTMFKPKLSPNPYDKRYDLNADGWINSMDVLFLKPYMGKSCK